MVQVEHLGDGATKISSDMASALQGIGDVGSRSAIPADAPTEHEGRGCPDASQVTVASVQASCERCLLYHNCSEADA
ncbi:hypothetical protein MRX96_058555 [Rhipicephalus microplus]